MAPGESNGDPIMQNLSQMSDQDRLGSNFMKKRVASEVNLKFLNDIMARSKAYWGYDAAFMKKFMESFCVRADYIHQQNTFIFSLGLEDVGWYSFSQNSEHQLELDNFFLHPDYIGKGIGKTMWNDCVSTAKSYNAPFFVVWSDPNAEGFYFKMGCIKIGERESPMMPNRYPSIFRYNLKS